VGKKATYHHGNLKEALVQRAEQEIEREGFENLKMQALTEAVGVQPSAAYRHYRNRESLLRSLARRSFDRWDAEIRALMARTSPQHQAEAILRFFLGDALARPQMFRLMFDSEYGRDARSIVGMVSFLTLEQALRQLMPEEDEEGVRTRLLWSWATLHGTALLLIEGRLQRFYVGNMHTESLIEDIIRALLPGRSGRRLAPPRSPG